MSSALAIAAVTAALKDLLNEGLLNHDLSNVGSFSVTAQPPDRITTGNTEANQLNVFLYQVTANPGWRNAELPSRDARGARLSNPPLALDLHYLLTAYGAQDLNAEVLLGFAMQLLHETPVLSRAQLRTVLGSPSPVDGGILPGPFGNLSAIDLADQIELLKITPVYLGVEDLSKLWTAMQARYRPSMAYVVSVVLIQSQGGGRAARPGLQRGEGDRGPRADAVPPPFLLAVRNAASPRLPALRLGEDASLLGTGLLRAGTQSVVFENARLGLSLSLPLQVGASANELRAHLPSVAEQPAVLAAWGVGVYSVSLRTEQPGAPTLSTNAVPVALSPRIAATPLAASAGAAIDLAIACTPRLHPLQHAGARLLLGSDELLPTTIATPADTSQPSTLHFSLPGLPAGTYLLRLRVDGIDSLPIVITGSPPSFGFDADQTLKVS